MRPAPLLMVEITAFSLAMLVFSLVLVAQTRPGAWLWMYNAFALVCGVGTFGYWLRAARRAS